MYRITYVHKNESTENPLYIPGDADYCLTTATLDLECGKSGELVVSLPDINPAKEDILCLTDEVIVYRDQEELWRGRPVTLQMDFDRTGTLTCEGILSYLYDTAFPPFEFEGSPKEFLQMVLDNHNSQVDSLKQFQMGDVTVEDNNDYINRSSIYYDKSLNVLVEKLIEDSLGGYFRVRIENGVRYLDYLESYDTQATQMVRFGENILDIAEEIEYSDLATVILPLGAKLKDDEGMDTDEYTTIESVNGGSVYYADEAAVNTYGWIVVIAEWSDVTVPDNLLTKAKNYLAQVTSAISSFTVNAIDLSLISEEEPIKLGDYVWIRSVPHGINQYIELTEQHIDILYPENDVLSFGVDTATLTGSQKATDRAVQSALGSLEQHYTHLSADVIDAVYANIETIVAGTINADYIYAICAEIGYLTADQIDAQYVRTDELEAEVGRFGYLTAESAVIVDLTAFSENVYTLLGGTGSFGTLDSIHLTSENAVIDQAVIEKAVAGTILADLIYADYINTDVINIMSDNGGITIIGNQMQFTNGQIQFYDENGVIRLQIGQDETGNFTFVLYDETGTGIMIDSEGIHESAVTDGLIVDRMVADDANISGYKLNIEEICSIINNGTYTIEAGSVTIDGQGLDAWYVEINEAINGLEGMTTEGLIGIVRYYCYWGSDTDAPPEDSEVTPAICGEAVCGLTICGLTEGNLWQIEPISALDGVYRWCKLLGSYQDGHTEWGLPYCLDDGVTREQTQVLQTELTVVQGLIDAKVWETDIESYVDPIYGEINTITENYAYIRIEVDSISEQVGSLVTTEGDHYLELTSQISGITIDLDGIRETVSATEQTLEKYGQDISDLEAEIANMDGIESWIPYFCLWYSGSVVPPDNDGLTDAICGTAVCGTTICGVTGGNFWTTADQTAGDGQYKWVKYLLTYVDGTTSWYGPYCLTDVYTRSQITSTWAQLDVLSDRITAEVGSVQTIVNNNYEYFTGQIASLEMTAQGIEATVSDLTVEIGDQISKIENEIASIDGLKNATPYFCLWYSATVTPPDDEDLTAAICGTAICGTTVCGVTTGGFWTTKEPTAGDGQFKWIKYRLEYEDGSTAWSTAYCLTDQYSRTQISAAWAQFDVLSDRITAEVGSLESTIDSNYSYFSSRIAELEIEAGDILLRVAATEGDITDLQTADATLELGIETTREDIVSYINASADVITLTGDRISISSDNFELTYDGEITATKGYIGGFTIGTYKIYGGDPDLNQACVMQVPRGDDESSNRWWVFAAGGDTHTTYTYAPFRVGSNGYVYAPYLNVGSSSDTVNRRVIVRNSNGSMSLSAEEAGNLGLYNWKLEEWFCRYYPTDDVNRFGNGNRGTEIYGNGISMMTSVTTTGSITSGSSSSTSAQRVYAYNSYAHGSLSVDTNGNFGLYDWGHTKWVIYSNSSGSVTTNSAIATLAEYDVDDISTLSSATFRDPNHEVVTHVNSHTYKVDGKKHLGLTVNELEAAMKDAGMDPDEYDITDRVMDEDGNEHGAIRYDELIPMLFSEIQSLNERVAALEN